MKLPPDKLPRIFRDPTNPYGYPYNIHETDGLSRNPDDCAKWGCVENAGGSSVMAASAVESLRGRSARSTPRPHGGGRASARRTASAAARPSKACWPAS